MKQRSYISLEINKIAPNSGKVESVLHGLEKRSFESRIKYFFIHSHARSRAIYRAFFVVWIFALALSLSESNFPFHVTTITNTASLFPY
jgi:hypothetical protein